MYRSCQSALSVLIASPQQREKPAERSAGAEEACRGRVAGIVTAFELLGAAVGAVASGVMFDAFSSSAPAWIMVIVASVVMGAALLASIPAARRLVERRRAQGAPELAAEGFEIEAAGDVALD